MDEKLDAVGLAGVAIASVGMVMGVARIRGGATLSKRS
jgi:hypothetical protein